jgi:YHS domain-containing protein
MRPSSPQFAVRATFVAVALAFLVAGCGTRNAVVADRNGEPLILLGHDPVAYFAVGKAIRGNPDIAAHHDGNVYYFVSDQHRRQFLDEPARYAPQYGGFCASGAAYGVKLGSDPTEWRIVDGRLFIFGDVLGREYWLLDPRWHIEKADLLWPETGANGHRYQSLKRFVVRVPWYKDGRTVHAEWQAAHPGRRVDYDPGGVIQNLFVKYPGWRAREGHQQPMVGLVGVDACPPACVGAESKGFSAP